MINLSDENKREKIKFGDLESKPTNKKNYFEENNWSKTGKNIIETMMYKSKTALVIKSVNSLQ